MIYLSSQHYFFATTALLSLVVAASSGFLLLTKFCRKFFKIIMVIHTFSGLIALVFIILTYFLVLKL